MSFRHIDRLTEPQIDELTEMYQHEWWSKGRTREDVARMLDGTAVVIALVDAETDRLAGFCRLLSDGMYRALLLDVIVAEPYRNQGLGRKLVEAVVGHPELKQVPVIWLCCEPNMTPFYEKWGFEFVDPEIKWMYRALKWPS
jgi:GNAT superfamily N-acetyltransferase